MRTNLVLLVLGTAAPLVLLAGILIASAASDNAERFSHERFSTFAYTVTSIGPVPRGWIRTVPIVGETSQAGDHAAELSAETNKAGIPGDAGALPLKSQLMPLLLGSCVLVAISLALTLLLAQRIVRPVIAVERPDSMPALGYARRQSDIREPEEAAAREAAQARLNQAQRMQALGQIASGMAHDFNNVLQAIGGALFLITRQPDDAARVARFVAIADDAAQRGAAITGRLLALARKDELRTGPVDPALLLSGMAELFSHTLGAAIVIRVDAAPDLAPLWADRGQLETVLINLATNARDAMPEGGTLTLSAVFDPHAGAVGTGSGVVPDPAGSICIAVADTGEGMDAATIARASEPFFTTKGVGHGTGLGLTMARSFAAQSGGTLLIESVQNTGTTVRIWLPCAMSCALAVDRAPVSAPAALRTPPL